ncbi:hypothetical protein CPC08DRAFT_729206 [Agrocybe pediades]|nr:hypothetical protein CPC08DRAFT_729206 [Agrocybe pediades]
MLCIPNATVLVSNVKHVPCLSEDKVTPAVLHSLFDAHDAFFTVKDIDDKDKVKMVLPGLRDPTIHSWIRTHKDRLLKMTYKDFTVEFHKRFLPANWVASTYSELVQLCMKPHMLFTDYATSVTQANIILEETPSHLDKARLHNQIIAVTVIDNHPKLDRKRSGNHSDDPNAKHPALSSNSRGMNTASSTPLENCCPFLTPLEKALLKDNCGCFKCQHFNQNHIYINCPIWFPAKENYREVTLTRDAAAKLVVAVQNAEEQEQLEDESNFCASVMPSVALGNSSDSEDDDS